MKTTTRRWGWLVIAAALIMSLASCSNNDNEITVSSARTIQVTVGAGISNGAQTRSTVAKAGTTRTLQFSKGDRLYVRANINHGFDTDDKYGTHYYPQILAGYLTLDTKSLDPADPTTATFSGGLTIYECAEEEWLDDADVRHQYAHSVASSLDPSTYFKVDDPFDDCCDIEAILVHADEGYSFSLDPDRYGSFTRGIAETPEALMTSLLTVRGGYTNSTKTFTLAAADNQPILSCTISGLTPGSQYTVEYGCKTTGNDFSLTETSPYGNVTADGTGTATFAFFGATTADAYHALRFVSMSDYYDLKLVKICADGSPKTLTNKVYSLTRTAIVDPLTPTPPTKPTVKRYNGLAYEAVDLSETPGTVNLSGDTQNLTISGYSVDYRFEFYGSSGSSSLTDATITLGGTYTDTNGDHTGGIATCSGTAGAFLSATGSLTVKLAGDYTIDCSTTGNPAIYVNGTLKLGLADGDKGPHNLVVITKEPGTWKGLTATANYYDSTRPDADNLAADGAFVTLASQTNNGNGTWTFVYHVQKAVRLTAATTDVQLEDGDILTGTGGEQTHVKIADGATVTLHGVTIRHSDYYSFPEGVWPGITCLGSATIVLADGTTNVVEGFDGACSAIFVPHNKEREEEIDNDYTLDYTLTIKGGKEGTGRLIAVAKQAAAIGGGDRSSEGFANAGNITIEGGNIIAMGGYYIDGDGDYRPSGSENPASGIGAYRGQYFGFITISGGTVEAIGSNAPGIGSPDQGKIERGITISGGTVTAKAICSGDCSAPGIGIGGVSGEIHRPITFSGGTVTVIGSGPKAPAIGIISEGRIDDDGDIIIGEDDKPLSLSLTLTRGGSGSGPLGGPTDQNNNFVGKIRIPGLREVALPWDGENADQLGMTRSADGNTWTYVRNEE